jgi:hypothetical protein
MYYISYRSYSLRATRTSAARAAAASGATSGSRSAGSQFRLAVDRADGVAQVAGDGARPKTSSPPVSGRLGPPLDALTPGATRHLQELPEAARSYPTRLSWAETWACKGWPIAAMS